MGFKNKVQKKYYLPRELTEAVAHRCIEEGITQSAFLERALRRFLKGRRRI